MLSLRDCGTAGTEPKWAGLTHQDPEFQSSKPAPVQQVEEGQSRASQPRSPKVEVALPHIAVVAGRYHMRYFLHTEEGLYKHRVAQYIHMSTQRKGLSLSILSNANQDKT